MAREDVGKALKAMDDDKLREQIAGGGLAGLEGLNLSDDEKEMVIGAAEDYPEVSGFGVMPWQASSSAKISPDMVGKLNATGRFGKAAAYAFGPGFDQDIGGYAPM